jgi:hypothetical protein
VAGLDLQYGQRDQPIPTEATKGPGIKTISAEEFDRKFDAGEDISEYVDWSKARRPNLEPHRFNVEVPAHFIQKLDRAARIRGVTRQSLVKMWLYDRLQQEREGSGT